MNFSDILNGNKEDVSKIKDYEKKPIKVTGRNVSFAVMSLGTFFLFVMFSSQIITGVAALVITTCYVVVGFFGIRFLKTMDPLIQQKTKNLVLKKMMEEAQKNAVYQLDNRVIENKSRLEKARVGRDKMGGLVQRLKSQVATTNKDKPIYKRKVAMLSSVEKAYNEVCVQLDKGAKANRDFEEKVEEFKDMNNFTGLVGEAMSIASSAKGDKMDEMLSLAAFESIEEDFNTALISIENKASDMKIDSDDQE
jgi:hypothetical protein